MCRNQRRVRLPSVTPLQTLPLPIAALERALFRFLCDIELPFIYRFNPAAQCRSGALPQLDYLDWARGLNLRTDIVN